MLDGIEGQSERPLQMCQLRQGCALRLDQMSTDERLEAAAQPTQAIVCRRILPHVLRRQLIEL
ncbi:hypothetical protein D3C80_1549150 [compost metagenome]